MRHPLAITLLVVTLLAGLAATAGAAVRFIGISGFSASPVANAPSIKYTLRSFYLAPEKWKVAKAKPDAITRRFGPIGTCRFKLTVTARAVADAEEPAATRVARLLPANGRYLRDQGTRGTAAWRVIRATGSDTTTGMLMKTATGVRTRLAGRRVWLELRAVAKPTASCHSGGPRAVADGIATMLATGSLGGFESQ